MKTVDKFRYYDSKLQKFHYLNARIIVNLHQYIHYKIFKIFISHY